MAELNAQSVADFVASVDAGASEAAGAFARTFDSTVSLKSGNSGPFDAATFPPEFWKPGLALIMVIESQGVVILIPSATGLVPDWCKEPDATGKSKLATFAQEWGLNLLPEDFFADENLAGMVDNLGQNVIDYGKINESAGYVEILIEQEGKEHAAYMIWPILEPHEVLKVPEQPENVDIPGFALPAVPVPSFIGQGAAFGGDLGEYGYDGDDFADADPNSKPPTAEDLPGFSHSLLKVRVPVAAVLARARKPIKSILELGIGSVIQFDKSCDDPIELEIDRTIIGNGEAVKVGDKFGLRISTMLLPKERFRKVEIRRDGEYKKQKRLPQIIGKAPIKSLEPYPQTK
ncbi:MAG TPA: hypothetical protein DEB39_15410 [Planctomycetaceae bacterium]|nr:hypothetical protein [Planctomycetaceae bacterium]